jgi:hypothetical protein
MKSVALAFAAAAIMSPALADTAPPSPPPMKVSIVRGTVESVDATTIKIKTDAGAEIAAAVTPKTSFNVVEARTFAQLKPTDFVGITAVPGRNGHLKAEEVHIIPVVGVGEGQYPWDHHPSTSHETSMGSMTNGSVTRTGPVQQDSMTNGSVTGTSGGNELTVTYKGSEIVNGQCEGRADPTKPGCTGTATVDVVPTTAIAAIVKGSVADAKPGLAVVGFVATDPQGHAILGSATFEKNGVKPEF